MKKIGLTVSLASILATGLLVACESDTGNANNNNNNVGNNGDTLTFIEKADYDLSDEDAGGLLLGGVEGDVQSIIAVKGEESENITRNTSKKDGELVVDKELMQGLSAGVWTFTVTTNETTYVSEVTVATYILSDYYEFRDFHTATKNGATATADWYVLLDGDINASDSATGSRMLGNGKWCSFNGVFDGRGHTISNLQANRYLFRYVNGTIQNVAFTDYTQYGTLHEEYACFVEQGTGTIKNVYFQASVPEDSFVAFTDLKIENVVLDMTYTGVTPTHVLFGGDESNLMMADNALSPAYTSDTIYVIAKSQVENGEVYFSRLYREINGSYLAIHSQEEVYLSSKMLVNRRNQEGKMFDESKGWSKYWSIVDGDVAFGK